MEDRSKMLLLAAAFLFQCLLLPAMSAPSNVDDQKSFFPIPPIVSVTPPAPAKGSGSGHATPTPSGGSVKPPINCGTPPSGGHHSSSPSSPKRGSGGYHHSTPSPSHKTPISKPAPAAKNPPTTPVTPVTPVVPTPASPPFSFGPVSPPFTCIYWKTHPTLIWGLIGWVGTVGGPVTGGTLTGTFGVPNLPGLSSKTDLLQALSNTRVDGYGDLYREGTAAFLNSLAHSKYPYTTAQVKLSFLAALSSNKAAADQAQIFKRANEGSM